MIKLRFIQKDIKSLYNDVKRKFFTLDKIRKNTQASYLDKMVYTVFASALPLMEDYFEDNLYSLSNLSRIKTIIEASALLNLKNDSDFVKYNIPLFESQFDLQNYYLGKETSFDKEDKKKLKYAFDIASKNFSLMSSRDVLHTSKFTNEQLIQAEYPILLGRNLEEAIRVNLGYLYDLMYKNISLVLRCYDYRFFNQITFKMYFEDILVLLMKINSESHFDNLLVRTHQVNKQAINDDNIQLMQKRLVKIINKLKPNYSDSYLYSSLIAIKNVINSIQVLLKNNRYYNLGTSYLALIDIGLNLFSSSENNGNILTLMDEHLTVNQRNPNYQNAKIIYGDYQLSCLSFINSIFNEAGKKERLLAIQKFYLESLIQKGNGVIYYIDDSYFAYDEDYVKLVEMTAEKIISFVESKLFKD